MVAAAMAAGRHEEAASEAPEVLAKSPEDETTIQYAVSVLSQNWDVHGPPEGHLRDLAGLGTAFDEKPPVLAVLACEQFKAGRRRQARQNVEKALRLAPGHKLALEVRARWSGGN